MSNKFKNVLVLLFIVSSFCHIEAQEQSLKLYTNLFRFRHHPTIFENNSIDFRGLSLAYKYINDNRIAHEFEARFNTKSRSLPDDTFKNWEAQFRYEIGKYWMLSDKLFVQRSVATSLYHLSEDINVATYNIFPQKNTYSGAKVSCFIHLEYYLTNHIYLDLNTSLISTSFEIDITQIENPNLTENQQRQSGFDFDVTFVSMFRIGVGYIFNKRKTDIK